MSDKDTRPPSELEEGLSKLGDAVETLTGRLLGEKVLGKAVPADRVAISPAADEAVEKVGEDLGRLLYQAGEGLKAHPLRPDEALHTAKDVDPAPPPEGLSPLSGGLLNLGSGLFKVTEAVLDKVAPRKPKVD